MTLTWRLPATTEVLWRGLLPAEGGQVTSGPLIGPYLVPNAAGLLVAIATHGAIAQGVQSGQRKREQDDADKVLESYAPALKAWPASSLWEAAVAGSGDRLWDGAAPAQGPVVELSPVFILTQDEDAVLLDVSVKIVHAVGLPPVEVLVRVVSSPLGTTDARAHWSADGANRIKVAAAAMLSHAVRVAMQHVVSPSRGESQPARTIRYLQGRVERSERAQQLSASCARVVARTLRGGLLSVPVRQAAEGDCATQPAF